MNFLSNALGATGALGINHLAGNGTSVNIMDLAHVDTQPGLSSRSIPSNRPNAFNSNIPPYPNGCTCPFCLGVCTCDLCSYLKSGTIAYYRFLSTERANLDNLPSPETSDRLVIWYAISNKIETHNLETRDDIVHKRHHGLVEDDIAAHYIHTWYEISCHNEKVRTRFMKDGDAEGAKKGLKVLEGCGCRSLGEHREKCEGKHDEVLPKDASTVNRQERLVEKKVAPKEKKSEKPLAGKNGRRTIGKNSKRSIKGFTVEELEKENIQAEKDNERRKLGLSPVAPKPRGRNGSVRINSTGQDQTGRDDVLGPTGGNKVVKAPLRKKAQWKTGARRNPKMVAAEEVFDTITVKKPEVIVEQRDEGDDNILDENILDLDDQDANSPASMAATLPPHSDMTSKSDNNYNMAKEPVLSFDFAYGYLGDEPSALAHESWNLGGVVGLEKISQGVKDNNGRDNIDRFHGITEELETFEAENQLSREDAKHGLADMHPLEAPIQRSINLPVARNSNLTIALDNANIPTNMNASSDDIIKEGLVNSPIQLDGGSHRVSLKHYNADNSMNVLIPSYLSNTSDESPQASTTMDDFFGINNDFYEDHATLRSHPLPYAPTLQQQQYVDHLGFDEEQLRELELMKAIGGSVFEKYKNAGFDFGFVGMAQF